MLNKDEVYKYELKGVICYTGDKFSLGLRGHYYFVGVWNGKYVIANDR